MKTFFEYLLWILFAVLWIWLWWWIVTERGVYSQVKDNPDPWWYMRIGVPDTSFRDSFYDSIMKGIDSGDRDAEKDSFY